ncbi:MarR family winged helix-turn-helix transcriptional regulator [Nocardioides alcanivorans]|uniref:MarR family winged helix-turn-helix transcriptional regulator n=1 Tax=Nocardioides alcanivorans TaxID=2897352 RepID=UPI001F231DF3|nr:MarR family transcriptional regulator [Nocardioides alcanivorans]
MTEHPADLLQAAARQLRRRHAAALARWEIAPAQARALRVVCTSGGPRLSVIAERLRIAPRSATEVVDALEDRGLVRRLADPGDRRATCVEPTTRGRELCDLIEAAREAEGAAYLSVLSPAERASLGSLLERLLSTEE